MTKLNLPPIGARNIKTALAIFICILLFNILDKDTAFFACVAAMMCMQDTVENSFKMGKNRMLGTILGGLVGIFITFLSRILEVNSFIYALLTCLGTILVIYLCVLSKAKGAVNSGCIVLFAITTNLKGMGSYEYAIYRTIDTFIGVFIGILINRFVFPYASDNDDKKLDEIATSCSKESEALSSTTTPKNK